MIYGDILRYYWESVRVLQARDVFVGIRCEDIVTYHRARNGASVGTIINTIITRRIIF